MYIDNVEYSNEPAKIQAGLLNYAFTTGKRRHALRVLEIAHRAAYFIKRTQWQYECERRLVVAPDDVQEKDYFFVADVGSTPLRCIIIGSEAKPALRQLCEDRAKEFDIPVYELRNGRQTYTPFFADLNGAGVFQWDESDFQEITSLCPECNEPGATMDGGKCIWCAVDPQTQADASKRSLLFLTLSMGLEQLSMSFDGLKPKGWKTKDE